MRLARSYQVVLGLAVIYFTAPSTVAGQVVCTASVGYHCETDSGCDRDATYISIYDIDRENRIVVQSSVQHTQHDARPKSDGTQYSIVASGTSMKTGEFTITAVANVGTAAVETLLIGERSYLSASVSNSIPRVFLMMGTCEGLTADEEFPYRG